MPTVSVVIPTFNRDQLVTRAVDSVLAQTLPPDEVIVIDDGSRDDTRDVLAVYGRRIRYAFQENQGVAAARNHGLKLASGRYIAFLDSDDEWMPHKLERQIQHLESHPEVAFVACLDVVDDPQYNLEPFRDARRQFRRFLIQPFFSNPSRYLVRRECFQKFGLFDPRFPPAEDLELWLRFLRAGCRFDVLPEPLMSYHVSSDAISRNPRRMLAGDQLIRDEYVRTLPWQERLWVDSRFTARMYRNAAVGLRVRGCRREAFALMLRSLAANPFWPKTLLRGMWLTSLLGDLVRHGFGSTATPQPSQEPRPAPASLAANSPPPSSVR